jgi:hypothetical protein
VPDADTVIHETFVDVVHAHDDCVVTVNVLVAPAGETTMREGVTENVHPAAGSVTRKLCPAIVRVAVLGTVVVLAVAENPTVNEPE